MEGYKTKAAVAESIDMLPFALKEAARGRYIVLSHTVINGKCTCKNRGKCRTPGKHPLFNDWETTASKDPKQITKWLKKDPWANIGYATGKSGELVLDQDSYNEGFEGLGLPESDCLTPTVITGGGGAHLQYDTCGDTFSNTQKLNGTDNDIRSTGGMALLPPSLHASGKRYRYKEGFDPDKVGLLPVPEQLAETLSPAGEKGEEHQTSKDGFEEPSDQLFQLKRAYENLCLINSSKWFFGSREDWLAGGMPLTELGYHDGFILWHHFSKDYDGFSEEELKKNWDSFFNPYPGKKRTLAALEEIAQREGGLRSTKENRERMWLGEKGKIFKGLFKDRLKELESITHEHKWVIAEVSSKEIVTIPDMDEYLVLGLFLKESLNMILGFPGHLKSMLLADLYSAFLHGGKWIGIQVPKIPVLWVDVDQGQKRTTKRFHPLWNYRGLNEKNTEGFHHYLSFPQGFDFYSDNIVEDLTSYLLPREIKAFFVDTFGASHTAPENESVMSQVQLKKRTVIENTGATQFDIAHPRKSYDGSRPTVEDIKGSINISGAIDSAISIFRPDIDEPFVNAISAKNRDQTIQPFGAKFFYAHYEETGVMKEAWFERESAFNTEDTTILSQTALEIITNYPGLILGEIMKKLNEHIADENTANAGKTGHKDKDMTTNYKAKILLKKLEAENKILTKARQGKGGGKEYFPSKSA